MSEICQTFQINQYITFIYWKHPYRWLFLPIIVFLLAGCSATPGVPATALPATQESLAVPTLAPSATPAPTVVPATALPIPTLPLATATPPEPTASATALLPATAFFTDLHGRIYQIDTDGTLASIVDTGVNGALTFDVNSQGDLAYVVIDAESARLELLGGDQTEATSLLSLPQYQISTPIWVSDTQIAVFLEGTATFTTGLYLVSAIGGDPQLLTLKNKPEELVLQPIAASPDRTLLLVGTTVPGADYCGQAVVNIASGVFTELQPPNGTLTDCTRAAWSNDSTRILLTLQDAGAYAATIPGLFQADPTNGAITLLIAGKADAGFVRMAGVAMLPSNELGLFVATTPTDAPPEPDTMWKYVMARANQDGSGLQTIRQEPLLLIDAAWAPAGSGAIVFIQASDAPDAPTELRWLPSDGSEAVKLGEIEGAYGLRWGR